MKLLRGTNLWLKTNSNATPFGPLGVLFQFGGIQWICFILVSYILWKNKKNLKEVHIFACMCAQSYPTLGNLMDCSPPGSSVHGILQARILEWVAVSSSRGSSPPSDRICISWNWILYHWATGETQNTHTHTHTHTLTHKWIQMKQEI